MSLWQYLDNNVIVAIFFLQCSYLKHYNFMEYAFIISIGVIVFFLYINCLDCYIDGYFRLFTYGMVKFAFDLATFFNIILFPERIV